MLLKCIDFLIFFPVQQSLILHPKTGCTTSHSGAKLSLYVRKCRQFEKRIFFACYSYIELSLGLIHLRNALSLFFFSYFSSFLSPSLSLAFSYYSAHSPFFAVAFWLCNRRAHNSISLLSTR